MPTREGLTLALERAQATQRDPATVLKEISETPRSPTERTYARAALRELAPEP
jgi:hypothetical protein